MNVQQSGRCWQGAPEHPILFTGANVRAIGEGRKFQTRRLVTARNSYLDGGSWPKGVWGECRFDEAWIDKGPSPAGNEGPYLKVPRAEDCRVHRVYPRWQRRDTLWVRETWGQHPLDDADPPQRIVMRADGSNWWGHDADGNLVLTRGDERDDCPPWVVQRWRPAIFMPRWACRELLTITAIRPERLQDISEADARAEGFTSDPIPCRINGELGTAAFFDPIRWYASVWDAINPKAPWRSNPWVWVVTFERRK